MATVRQLAEVHVTENPEPLVERPRRLQQKRERAKHRQVHPEALRVALQFVDGDYSRLVFEEDGSITSLNKPRSHYR